MKSMFCGIRTKIVDKILKLSSNLFMKTIIWFSFMYFAVNFLPFQTFSASFFLKYFYWLGFSEIFSSSVHKIYHYFNAYSLIYPAWISILYTDWFYAFYQLPYSCIQFIAQYIYNCLIRYLYHIKIIWSYFESLKKYKINQCKIFFKPYHTPFLNWVWIPFFLTFVLHQVLFRI